LTWTDSEWNSAKRKVEGRCVDINGDTYFPIAKDKLIPYTDTLIKQTIFGTQTAENFLKQTVGLQDLVNDTKKKAEDGNLIGMYGHHLNARSPHSALNLLLQHAGAVFMKYYLHIINKNITAAGLVHGIDYGYVANIHDAINIETTQEVADIICPILEEGFAEASRDLNLKYPVVGKPAVGHDQWETH
jgi:DNA polymerase-1